MPKQPKTDPAVIDSLTKLNESLVVVDPLCPPDTIYAFPPVKSVLDDEKKRLADDIMAASPLHEYLDHSTHRSEHERYVRWAWDQNVKEVSTTPLTEKKAKAIFHSWNTITDPLHMDKPEPDHSAEHHTPFIVAHAWQKTSIGLVWVCSECGEQVAIRELLQVFGRYDEPSLCDLIVAKRTEGSRKC